MIYKSPIYSIRGTVRWRWKLAAIALGTLAAMSCRWPLGHYEYTQEHCIVTEKGVRPKLVGNGPNYWIMLTCPNVYEGKPWAEDLPYGDWAAVQPNAQRMVTVRHYVR